MYCCLKVPPGAFKIILILLGYAPNNYVDVRVSACVQHHIHIKYIRILHKKYIIHTFME